MESMKDRIELYEFEKEETKIWQDEQMVGHMTSHMTMYYV